MSGEGGAEDEARLNSNGKASMEIESQGESIGAAADGPGDKEVDCTGAGVLDITSPPSEEKENDEVEKKKLKAEEPAVDATIAPAIINEGGIQQQHRNIYSFQTPQICVYLPILISACVTYT